MERFIFLDPEGFKKELIEEIKKLLPLTISNPKQWLRSAEVCEMLNISASTLQSMRIKGELPASKIGGTWLYSYDLLLKVLEANQIGRKGSENGK